MSCSMFPPKNPSMKEAPVYSFFLLIIQQRDDEKSLLFLFIQDEVLKLHLNGVYYDWK